MKTITNSHHLDEAIRYHFPVRASALTATNGYPGSAGRLSGGAMLDFYYNQDKIVYIVKSYDTPIAWCRANGAWTVVLYKFSTTTTRHQNLVYRAIKALQPLQLSITTHTETH